MTFGSDTQSTLAQYEEPLSAAPFAVSASPKLDWGRVVFLSEPYEHGRRHVEDSLREASGLLGKALAELRLRFEYRVRDFELAVDIERDRQLKRIHEDEVAHKYYSLPGIIENHELDRVKSLLNSRADITAKLEAFRLRYYATEKVVAALNRAAEIAIANKTPFYQTDGGKPYHRNFAGTSYQPADLAEQIGKYQAGRQLDQERISNTRDLSSSKELEDSNKAAVDAQTSRADWAVADGSFRRRRTEVEIAAGEAVAKARQSGELDYRSEIAALDSRITQTVSAVVSRIKAVQEALKQLYRFNEEPPLTLENYDSNWHHALATWLDKALLHISKVGRQEQGLIAVVSLKRVCTNWDAARAGARTEFTVPSNLFGDDSYFVRMRGVGANAVWTQTGRSDNPVSFQLTMPRQAKFRVETGSEEWAATDQSDLPPVRIGRVLPREIGLPADLHGVMTWRNGSPIAEDEEPGWSIEGLAALGLDADTISRELDDVQIEFHVVFRASPIQSLRSADLPAGPKC